MTTFVIPRSWQVPLDRLESTDSTPVEAEKANPYHDDLGRFAPAPGSAGGGVSLTLTRVEGAGPFDGKPVPQFVAVKKTETGDVAEEVAKAFLFQEEGRDDVRKASLERNNFPVDVVHDHQVVEVKGGRIDAIPASQQWRLTIGQPSKEEAEWLKTASKEDKAKHNQLKVDAIAGRKEQARRQLEREVGAPVSTRTISVVVDHDNRVAHVYSFDGFHKRIGWTSEQAKAGYQGTYKFEPKVGKHLAKVTRGR